MDTKIQRRGIWYAAALMHKARGARAAKEAAARALAHRLRGDNAGFDIWSWILSAIRALEHRQMAMKAGNEGS